MTHSNFPGTSRVVAGIDVSQSHLDLAFADQAKTHRFDFDDAGIDRLAAILRRREVERVCLEATGGLQDPLVDRLHDLGFEVAVVNPRRISHYAKSLGLLEKSDAVDARAIAAFGASVPHRLATPRSPIQRETRALSTRRRQLRDAIVAQKNQRHAARDEGVSEMIDATIAFLEKQRDGVERRLGVLLRQDRELAAKAKILESVPGIGRATANLLLVEMPELGELARGQSGKLVGAAPIVRDSGALRGRRTILGGRGAVRAGLYMPTLTAIRKQPKLNAFYRRLIAAGKPPKVAITAALRKLVEMLNSLLKRNCLWSPNYDETPKTA
jgi:transposase